MNSPASAVERGESSQKKFFTLDEANRALAYVSRIVQDVADSYQTVMEARHRLEMPRPEDDPHQVRDEYDQGWDKLNDLIAELQQVGVELKDFEKGLIDFPCMHDGREIYLCWKLGEPKILAWHETDSGFSGRQDVASLEPVGAGAGEEAHDIDDES